MVYLFPRYGRCQMRLSWLTFMRAGCISLGVTAHQGSRPRGASDVVLIKRAEKTVASLGSLHFVWSLPAAHYMKQVEQNPLRSSPFSAAYIPCSLKYAKLSAAMKSQIVSVLLLDAISSLLFGVLP